MTIYHGNCLEVMKKIPDNTYSAIVTDPPYAIDLLGKDWDKAIPDERYWKEALRIVKPGGFIFAFGGSRTFHRLCVKIEDSGWIIKDMFLWLYGCISEDTEILTIDGWKRYHKDIDNDLVLAYNKDTKQFQFEKPTEVFYYENEYPAYRIQSDHTDQLVSYDHRVIVERDGEQIFCRSQACESEESVPFLESLSELPETIYDTQSHTSKKKQDVFKDLLYSNNIKEEQKRDKKSKTSCSSEMCCLQEKSHEKERQIKNDRESNLLKDLQRETSLQTHDRESQNRKSIGLVGRILGKIERTYEWIFKSFLERWYKQIKEKGELCGAKICEMPSEIFKNGNSEWNSYGISTCHGSTLKPLFNKGRSCSSYRSQSSEQFDREFNVVCEPIGTHETSRRIKTTRAKITEVEYTGKMWCVSIPSGAFVARRNGKIFITGNSAMAKSHDISKAIDEHLGAKREEIIVSSSRARNPKAQGQGLNGGQGTRPFIERAKKRGYHIVKSDKPVSTQAMDFDGYGTGFRPSHEPIIVAMKPLDTNYHTNALKHGIAGFDIQGNRIGDDEITVSHNKGNAYSHSYGEKGTKPQRSHETKHTGRHPANVIIDPIIASQLKRLANSDRYFYVAKPTKKEKGYFNNHPSVKPLELMRYLLRLLKQPNDATYILDPFCGSGTTLVAAEQLGIKCDGIEMNKEYIEIINSRIQNIKDMKKRKNSSKMKSKSKSNRRIKRK